MPSGRNAQEIIFAGQRLLLDAAGAVYWPEQEALVISDLHMEKGSFLGQFGAPLPRYDTRHTLERLGALMALYRPARVICLGDSFHDLHAHRRLEAADYAELLRLIGMVAEWHWVLGNHDPVLGDVPGFQHASLILGNITLLHEPEPALRPQIVGHYHPKVSLRLGGQRMSGKAFVHDKKLFIMPAFGSYTGGLDVRDEAIASLMSEPVCYMIYKERVWGVRQ